MPEQAPYDYIVEYYSRVQDKCVRFPREWNFTYQVLAKVNGGDVLNIGCGPTFFDHGRQFSRPAKTYVGLDLSAATIDFLKTGDDPRVVTARADFTALGTTVELVAADVFQWIESMSRQYDTIIARGVFGTFYGDRLTALLPHLRTALKPGGHLVKTTWHGPHRTAAETAAKLRYSYDTDAAPTPDEIAATFTTAGFAVVLDDRLPCNPSIFGWREIQNCVFRNP